ncbi:hypothetical protein PHYPSEUDO_013036 [Phytophthora pseudosyringae]|uniref:Elicitin-like protein n=1 Tax=Phytophthora pseudosyringae TaxID=221518 RepID=A0A8T1V8G3_9STRA|nr:hypothetical protein PHYPSEUDO_013036 [Phytophthora pseudosyringae]
MRSRRSGLLSLLIPLALFFTTSSAAECTNAEAASAESIWAAAAVTSACSPYVTQTDPVYVNAPCSATDCVAVVEGVAGDLPDCTFSGINNKIEARNALTACSGGDTEDAGSLMVATDAPATATGPDSSTFSSTGSSSALTPASTASATGCTTTEIKRMWNLYVATATSEECAPDAVVNGDNVQILAQCATNCTDMVKGLADELPNCFYDYEYINKKQDVQDQLDGCDGSATSVSVSLIPDSAVEFSSSSGSSAPVPGGSTSGSDQLHSGDEPSDTTVDSSNVGIGSNTSPPREEKLHLWVSLLAAIVVPFLS